MEKRGLACRCGFVNLGLLILVHDFFLVVAFERPIAAEFKRLSSSSKFALATKRPFQNG